MSVNRTQDYCAATSTPSAACLLLPACHAAMHIVHCMNTVTGSHTWGLCVRLRLIRWLCWGLQLAVPAAGPAVEIWVLNAFKKKKMKLNHFRGTGGDFSPTGKCS